MTATLRTISPVDGRVYVERPYATETEIAAALARLRFRTLAPSTDPRAPP